MREADKVKWACPICGHLLLRPVTKEVKACRYCSVDWNDALTEGRLWLYGNSIEVPKIIQWTAPRILSEYRPQLIIVCAGMMIICQHAGGNAVEHQWEFNPPSAYCMEKNTLYIHEGIADLFDRNF